MYSLVEERRRDGGRLEAFPKPESSHMAPGAGWFINIEKVGIEGHASITE